MKHPKVSALTVAICLFAAAGTPAQDNSYMSLAKYMELERGAVDKNAGSPLVTIYLGGVIESLGMANELLKREGQRPLFCFPSERGLSAERLRVVLDGYLIKTRRNVNDADFSAFTHTVDVGAASLFALKDNFPCR